MYNVFNKTICVCYYTNSSSGLLFIMCGYCYYLDPAAVRTCMQTNFTVHGQPPQFLIASAANDQDCASYQVLLICSGLLVHMYGFKFKIEVCFY